MQEGSGLVFRLRVTLDGLRMRVTSVNSQETGVPLMRVAPGFDQFYADNWDAVAGLAYALSGSRIASEDLAQEAFLAAYRRWETIGGYDSPGAWVRRVVANRSVSVFRRRTAEARAIVRLSGGHGPLPELSLEAADVLRAVRRLPRRQAQVVVLHYLQDLPLSEVAVILDRSVETIRTHLRRARKTLAVYLDVPEEET